MADRPDQWDGRTKMKYACISALYTEAMASLVSERIVA